MDETPIKQTGTLPLLIGGLLLVLAAYLARDIGRAHWVAAQWSRTRAAVTGSELVCSYDKDGEASCKACIDYEYETGDGAASARQVEVLRGKLVLSRITLAEQLAAAYPEGKLIDVYFKPSEPGLSDLGPANAPNPVLPAFLAAIGLLLLFNPRLP